MHLQILFEIDFLFRQNTASTIEIDNNKKNEFFGVYLDSTMSKKLLTKYLIISDGAESSLKNFLDIKSKEIDYSQTSFVFNANASFESSTAIQIFNKYGIFAMIPYAENKINLIWPLLSRKQ